MAKADITPKPLRSRYVAAGGKAHHCQLQRLFWGPTCRRGADGAGPIGVLTGDYLPELTRAILQRLKGDNLSAAHPIAEQLFSARAVDSYLGKHKVSLLEEGY